MAKASKFVAPDLSNATPSMLLDEMGKLSVMEGQIKKLRAFYKEAYYARMGIKLDGQIPLYGDDLFPQVEGVTSEGELFKATTTVSFPSRVSTTLLKEKYPDIAAECTVEGAQFTTRFSLLEGACNPVVNDLLEQMRKELDLD